jgi:hypothetical protein
MGMLRATPSWSSSPGGLEDAQLVTALARCGMGKVPEVTEGLLLHDVEQGVVVEIDLARGGRPACLGRARAGILARFCFVLGHCHLPCRPFLDVAERPLFAALPSTTLPAVELWLEPVGKACSGPAPDGRSERKQGPPGRSMVCSVRLQKPSRTGSRPRRISVAPTISRSASESTRRRCKSLSALTASSSTTQRGACSNRRANARRRARAEAPGVENQGAVQGGARG